MAAAAPRLLDTSQPRTPSAELVKGALALNLAFGGRRPDKARQLAIRLKVNTPPGMKLFCAALLCCSRSCRDDRYDAGGQERSRLGVRSSLTLL